MAVQSNVSGRGADHDLIIAGRNLPAVTMHISIREGTRVEGEMYVLRFSRLQ
jgi:hypothetical protein